MSAPVAIAVIGGGLMGGGIAQVFAQAGHGVAVCEPDKGARDALQARLAMTSL